MLARGATRVLGGARRAGARAAASLPAALQDTPAAEALQNFNYVFAQRVAWGDEARICRRDSFQHLNNVQYVFFAQEARVSYMQELGMMAMVDGIYPVLAAQSTQYLRPVNFPDTLQIGVRSHALTEDSFEQEYLYASEQQGRVVARGTALIVSVGKDGRRTTMPESIMGAVREMEGL